MPSRSSHSTIARWPSTAFMPENRPELIRTSFSVCAVNAAPSVSGAPPFASLACAASGAPPPFPSSRGATTGTIGSPNALAKS